MGKSRSVQQQERNPEFQRYLEETKASLWEKMKELDAEFQKRVEEYSRFFKVIPIGRWEKYDIRQTDEVTFDSLKETVDKTAAALFPGCGQDPGLSLEAKAAMERLAEFRGMAAAVSTNCLMEAMGFFRADQGDPYWYTLTEKSVAPGLTLHLLAGADAYQSGRWFPHTEMIVSRVCCALLFSDMRMREEEGVVYFDKQLKGIQNLLGELNRMQDRYVEMLIDIDTPEARLKTAEKKISFGEKQLRESQHEVEQALQAGTAAVLAGGRRNPS